LVNPAETGVEGKRENGGRIGLKVENLCEFSHRAQQTTPSGEGFGGTDLESPD